MVQRAIKFTPEVLLSAPRRSAGVPNPSGTSVLYTTSSYSFETHKKTIELRVLDVKSGESRELAHDDDISDLNWLDEDNFACLQAEKNGTTSLYVASVSAVGQKSEFGKSHYIAGKIEAPAGNLKVAELDDGSFAVVLSAQVTPHGELYEPAKAKKTQSTGRLYKQLFVRHWDEYTSREKNTLWYGKLAKGDDGKYSLSKLTNALQGTKLESPVPPFGGTDSFDVSKSGIIFVSKDPDLDPALHSRCNVYLISLESFESLSPPKPRQILIPNFQGACGSPVFSKDGKKAAFLSMKIDGYESDQNQIFVLPDVKSQILEAPQPWSASSDDDADAWDRSPQAICFMPDGNSFLATAEDQGHGKLFMISPPKKPTALTSHGYVSDIRPLTSGQIFISGSTLVDNSFFAIVDPTVDATSTQTAEIWSHSNSKQGSSFGLKHSQVSSIWTPASNPKINKEVHSWVFKPSSFEKGKSEKYPVAYLIHGGPQGSWGDSWSTRWNPAVFAEQGYIVIAPNPTGSTGYGQKFTDSIRRNWGGDPYEDIAKCFEWVGKNMLEVDNERAVALGASYGGYMMNWIQGHELGRKLKALVCHDGIFSMAGLLSTEELYFPFYDLGGTPWHSEANQKQRKVQENFGASTFDAWSKNDPSQHLSEWATPQLVIHNSKDYRLCISEGLAAFNVLQSRGVESEFLTFPDENHFVLKPENSLVWHKVVLNWINKYVGLPPVSEEDTNSDTFWGGEREGEELVEMAGQGKPET